MDDYAQRGESKVVDLKKNSRSNSKSKTKIEKSVDELKSKNKKKDSKDILKSIDLNYNSQNNSKNSHDFRKLQNDKSEEFGQRTSLIHNNDTKTDFHNTRSNFNLDQSHDIINTNNVQNEDLKLDNFK